MRLECSPLLVVGTVAMIASSWLWAAGGSVERLDERGGVEVVGVGSASVGEGFGLRVGDVLVGWQDGVEHGAVSSPLDVHRVEAERAPHGRVVLEIRRGREPLRLPMPAGLWEIELASIGPPDTDTAIRWARFADGRRHVAAKDFVAARAAFSASRSGAIPQGVDALLFDLEGLVWHQADQREHAVDALRRAVALRRRQAPNSVALARSLLYLVDASPRSERSALLTEAQAMVDTRAPESLLQAELRFHRATLDFDRERFDAAETGYFAALHLQGRVASTSHRIARTMFRIGRVRARQGRLDEAEAWMEQALDLLPSALEERVAGVANSLALVLRDKGDLTRARDTTLRALDSFRRLDAESMAVAGTLNNLGTLYLRLEDYDQAESRYREALDLMRRVAPESRYVGGLLHNLGRVAQERGDLVEARRFMLAGLEHKQRVAPGTATVANSMLGLGELSYEQGRFDEAERWARQALALREQISPGALRCAETRILLGMILAATDRFVEAEAMWLDGLDALDRANEGFRYTAQERSWFTSRFQEHYRHLASHYVRHDRIADAFDLLERSRARALRSYTRRHPTDGEPVRTVPARRPAIADALDLPTIRDVLDAGTRLVVFSVAEHETTVMVIADASRSADGVVVRTLPIGEDALQQQVELFRSLIERGRTGTTIEHALIQHGRALYEQLFAPAADALDEAKRLVIVPDGPLHTLPFAALVRSVEPVRWMAEWKPITLAVSATVFADAKSRRSSRRTASRWAIFARSRVAGERLPGVATEARRIARRAGSRARVWLDRNAREATLEAMLRDGAEAVDVLHLATHATVDERSPLDSALHLAPGRGEDGLLHAHEIIERFDVRSDLVVLSACNTGRGRTLASDGVLGLSHAFLFAGARSLITSLWAIDDPSTAEWMVTFYEHLDRGFTRDRALQEAQRHSLASGGHPFHWAAFQLWGDWGDRPAEEPPAVTRIVAANGAGIPATPRR